MHDAFGTSHVPVAEQLVLSLQVVKQAKAPQPMTVPVTQVPLPSQKRVEVSSLVAAFEQAAAAQIVEPLWKAHMPTRSHLPVVPQPMLPRFTQVPDGSVVPAMTCVHVPSESGRAQLKHWPQGPESQQTFSTQWPLPHSPSTVHILPRSFLGTQLPPLQ